MGISDEGKLSTNYNDSLNLLQQTIDKLNRAQSLTEIYDIAVKGIAKILNADCASILIFGADERTHFKAWLNLSDTYRAKVAGHSPWRIDETDAQPLCFSDVSQTDLSRGITDAILAEGIGALLFVPLRGIDRLLGKFMVYFKTPYAWSAQDMQLSQVIAQNLAAIIIRQQALEDTQRAEQKYRSMVEYAVEGIYQTTPEGRFLMVNPAMVEMFGYNNTAEMLAIRDVATLYCNAHDREKLIKLVEHKTTLRNIEVKMKRADGSPIWVLMNSRAVKNTAGKIIYYEGTLIDITERKQSEQILQESEERYQLLSDATFEAIFISEKGVCTGQNKTAEKMFGYSLEEAVGKSGTEWIIPADRELVIKNILSGYEQPYEVTALRKDGSTFPCEIQARMLEYRGKLIRITALRDITERKIAKMDQQQSEEKIHSLLRLTQKLELARSYADITKPLKDEIRKNLGYRHAWIYLFEENREYARLLSGAGEKEAELQTHAARLKIKGDAFLEEIAGAGHIVIVEDARTDPRTNKEIVARVGNRTIINIPIILENQRLGVIATGTFGDEGVRLPTQSGLEYLETVAHHVAIVIDRIRFINERAKTAERIAELAAFNKNIVSSAPIGILTLNLKGEVTSANNAFVEMMGSPDVAETLKLGMNIPTIKQAGIDEAFWKTLKTGSSFEINASPYRSHWGKNLVVNIKGVPQKTADGHITGIIIVVDDVTEQHHAEQKLITLKEQAEESENKFRAITTQSTEGITVADMAGHYIFVNPAFCKMVGYSEEELLQMTVFDVKAPEQDKSSFARSKTSNEGIPIQVLLQRKDGTEFIAEIVGKKIEFNGKKSVLGTIRDITAQKKAEQALRESEEKYRQTMNASLVGIYI